MGVKDLLRDDSRGSWLGEETALRVDKRNGALSYRDQHGDLCLFTPWVCIASRSDALSITMTGEDQEVHLLKKDVPALIEKLQTFVDTGAFVPRQVRVVKLGELDPDLHKDNDEWADEADSDGG